MAIYKTENVVKGEKAIWPWMFDYKQPTKSGYDFVGWEYNGTTYEPPFRGSPMESPFGPINGNAEIYAIWKKSAYSVEVSVPSDLNIIAKEGDGITISADFKQGSAAYPAPYSAIFEHSVSDDTWTKIHRGENSNNITYIFPAKYGVDGFMVVMNNSEINSIDDYLAKTKIDATISQAGEHTYEVDITSDKDITYNIGDEIEIAANFKMDGEIWSGAYPTIFKINENEGDTTYTKISSYSETSDNISFKTTINEDNLKGFLVVMSDEVISKIIESPKNYLAKSRIYARKQGDTGDLDTLLEPFETYLKSKGYIESTIKEKSPTLYGYLEDLYNKAEEEWDNSDSELFASSTYEQLDIFNCHGENNQYDDLGNKAMHMWLIAMQLSELIPDSDETNEVYRVTNTIGKTNNAANNTTELFRIAYDLGNEKGYGKTIPIYGPEGNYYTPKSDLMIARLVAGVIYSKNWQNHRETIPQMRQDLGGSTITVVSNPGRPDKDWGASSLKFETIYDDGDGNPDNDDENLVENNILRAKIGYTSNLMSIFPHAPGPYACAFRQDYGGFGGTTICSDNDVTYHYPFCRRFAWQNDDGTDISNDVKALFDLTEDGNLVNDNENNYGNYFVDKHVYDAAVSDYNIMENELIYDAEGYYKPNDEHSENLQDVMDAYIDEEEEAYLFKKDASYTDEFLVVSGNPCSSAKTESVKISGDGVYNEDVIGKDLSPYDNVNSPFMLLIRRAMRAAKDTRHIYGDFEYGRRRPGGGLVELNVRNTSSSGCGLRENHGLQPDNPNYCNTASYPSGHTTGGWATAMILTEMFPERYNEIFKSGYTFGVSREIARAHWHSDVMYARVIATMALPLIHAMEDYTDTYDAANNYINSGGWPKINLKIVNNSTKDITITREIAGYLANPDVDGNSYGWSGCYNSWPEGVTRYLDNNPNGTITIGANGDTTEYYLVDMSEETVWYGTRGFADDATCLQNNEHGYHVIKLYQGEDPETRASIQDYPQYNVKVSIVNDEGRTVVIDGVECVEIVDGGYYTLTIEDK